MSYPPFKFVRPAGKDSIIEFNDGRRYHTVAYGGEGQSLMRSLEDETSSICKLVNLASRDVMVRSMLFLDFKSTFSTPKLISSDEEPDWFYEMYTTDRPPNSSLVVPIPQKGNSFDENLVSIENILSVVTESMEFLLNDVRFAINLLQKASDTFMVRLVEKSVEEVARSPAFKHRSRQLSSDRIAEISKQVFDEKVLPDIKKKIEEQAEKDRGRRPTGSILDNSLKHYRVLKLSNNYRTKFQKLSEVLSNSINHELNRNDVIKLLRNLVEVQAIQELRIQGSCTNSGEKCNNYIEAYDLDYLSTRCKRCKQNSMSWLVFAPIERRIRHAWQMGLFPEMIVGGVLSGAPWVDEIYVREKLRLLPAISSKRQKKKQKACEVDCIIKTKDEKLILVESTSSHDQENVMNNFTDKIRTLEPLNYDGLFYITPIDLKRYFPMVDKKAVLFGARQLPDIAGQIEGAMKHKMQNPIKIEKSS